jgi:hypothetical protein
MFFLFLFFNQPGGFLGVLLGFWGFIGFLGLYWVFGK